MFLQSLRISVPLQWRCSRHSWQRISIVRAKAEWVVILHAGSFAFCVQNHYAFCAQDPLIFCVQNNHLFCLHKVYKFCRQCNVGGIRVRYVEERNHTGQWQEPKSSFWRWKLRMTWWQPMIGCSRPLFAGLFTIWQRCPLQFSIAQIIMLTVLKYINKLGWGEQRYSLGFPLIPNKNIQVEIHTMVVKLSQFRFQLEVVFIRGHLSSVGGRISMQVVFHLRLSSLWGCHPFDLFLWKSS